MFIIIPNQLPEQVFVSIRKFLPNFELLFHLDPVLPMKMTVSVVRKVKKSRISKICLIKTYT